jgi:hypothetical protein
MATAEEEPFVYRYDPQPAPDSLFGDTPGVTRVYRYIWSGKPGPALVQTMAAIVGGDGEIVLEPVGELEACEVVDDGTADG